MHIFGKYANALGYPLGLITYHATSSLPPGHLDAKSICNVYGTHNASFQKDHAIPAPAAHEPDVVIAVLPERDQLVICVG